MKPFVPLSSVYLIVGGLMLLVSVAPTTEAQTPSIGPVLKSSPVRVAVFEESTFPTYGFSGSVTPRLIAQDLRAAGISADLLNTDTLANSQRFNAKRYAALVLPYGNTFPQEAFVNMRRFHTAGGSLIMTSIPFTHPMVRLAAKGWSAKPAWGASVRRVGGASRKSNESALEITGNREDWSGVTSSRFAVQSGDVVHVSASLRSGTAKFPIPRTGDTQDLLLVRFFDANGKFISQEGVELTPLATWQTFQVSAVAPAAAVTADVSVQIRGAESRYFVGSFTVTANDKAVFLPNADISQRDPNVWNDLGHTDVAARWGANGIGVGGFAGPKPGVS